MATPDMLVSTVQLYATKVQWFYPCPTVKGCGKLEVRVRRWLLRAWARIPFVVIFTSYPMRPIFKTTHFWNYHEPWNSSKNCRTQEILIRQFKNLNNIASKGKSYRRGAPIWKFFPFAGYHFCLARVQIAFDN